jgi:hypothetical protein
MNMMMMHQTPPTPIRPPASTARAAGRSRGFAFTEVLFAVMVLGIGFIMIAAMFPITIRQTQSSMQDTHGANTAKGALAYLQSIASDVNFPVTATGGNPARVCSLPQAPTPTASAPNTPGFLESRGNYIDPNNPRIAWVPLYRRGVGADGTPEPYAEVIIIVMQSRNRPQYTATPQPITGNKYWSDLAPEPTFNFPAATLEPSQTEVALTYDFSKNTGVMSFPLLAGQASARPAPGAYVVISEDNSSGSLKGKSNGRIYQLGNPINEANQVWSLTPGADMIRQGAPSDDNDLAGGSKPALAYIVGRGYTDLSQKFDDTKPESGYSGSAQDIAVYTGFIQISR